MSRHAGPRSLEISIAVNEVNIPGPGRGEFIWPEREIGCLRFIKFDYTFMSVWSQVLLCRIRINEVKWWLFVIWEGKMSCEKALLHLSDSIIFRKN